MDKPCDCFIQISGHFYFYTSKIKGARYSVMPHLFVNNKAVRVNFCPVCGEDVRLKGIKFKPE